MESLSIGRQLLRIEAEAEADAVAIKILGNALTPEYLKLKEIERDMRLYDKVSQGDKVIVTNGNPVSPVVFPKSIVSKGE